MRVDPLPQQGQPAQLPTNARALVERIGPVTDSAVVANTHTNVRRNDLLDPLDGGGLTVLAASPNLLDVLNAHVRSGTFLTSAGRKFPTVVLGYVAASRLGIDRIRPGQEPPQVVIGHTWFTVVGVLGPMPLAEDIERSVIVGWEAAESTLAFDGHPTVVYVKSREDAIESVRTVLPPTLYPRVPGLLQVSQPSQALAAKRATQSNFSGLFLGLAGVALLVGGVGIANTMVISVLERRGEIALPARSAPPEGRYVRSSSPRRSLSPRSGASAGSWSASPSSSAMRPCRAGLPWSRCRRWRSGSSARSWSGCSPGCTPPSAPPA
nr:ABC transporter permease [Actinopolymorpha pittospori]